MTEVEKLRKRLVTAETCNTGLKKALENYLSSRLLSIDHDHNRTQEALALRGAAITELAKAM